MAERDMSPLVSLIDVFKSFYRRDNVSGRRSQVRAVEGVSLEIAPGEVLGLVGESGSGKSTLGRLAVGLLEPTSGIVEFENANLARLPRHSSRRVKREMQVIFQDPYSSLNPFMTVEEIIAEPFVVHRLQPPEGRLERIKALLNRVGLPNSALGKRPSEFSGGQQQRIAIARAIALDPKFVVADEAVSALDVSIQAQILNLFLEIQRASSIAFLFISHDLTVVRHVSDRVAVMYLGKLVEVADPEDLYSHPKHPYTEALLSAIPIPDPLIERTRVRKSIQRDLEVEDRRVGGCPFRVQCWMAESRCEEEIPPLRRVGNGNHWSACHFAENVGI